LLYDPGEKFSYAHDNDLLLFAVEGATGMDMEKFCQENIFG
jgi:CubicO group peptidase (beta-lactamase class C family)